jgi:PIN domain nuclease of toxin-antitoxin system
LGSDDSQLGRAAKAAIAAAGESSENFVSAITAWGVAMLVRGGQLELTQDAMTWDDTVAELPAVRFDARISVQSVELPGEFHNDPVDRIIVATARHFGAPLATVDLKIRDYPHVERIW